MRIIVHSPHELLEYLRITCNRKTIQRAFQDLDITIICDRKKYFGIVFA